MSKIKILEGLYALCQRERTALVPVRLNYIPLGLPISIYAAVPGPPPRLNNAARRSTARFVHFPPAGRFTSGQKKCILITAICRSRYFPAQDLTVLTYLRTDSESPCTPGDPVPVRNRKPLPPRPRQVPYNKTPREPPAPPAAYNKPFRTLFGKRIKDSGVLLMKKKAVFPPGRRRAGPLRPHPHRLCPYPCPGHHLGYLLRYGCRQRAGAH